MSIMNESAYDERTAHCQRVSYLCWRTGQTVGIEESVQLGLILAARLHHENLHSSTGQEGVTRLLESFATRILRPEIPAAKDRWESQLEVARQILNACNELDESVEFAAYEQMPIAAAIGEFFEDAATRAPDTVVNSLRRITSATWPISLDRELPVLPAAAMKLMKTSPEDVSVDELELIAATDPVLAGKLLGAANSALFGRPSKIGELRQAILRLGIPLARKALLSACFGVVFASRTLAELWRHSQLVAAISHELAGACGYDQDAAYVAGLLHDIGRLLTQRCPAGAQVAQEECLEAGFPLVYAESLIYGSDHATLGGKLLRKWTLPAEIVEAVEFHHSPERADSVLAGILYLAEEAAAVTVKDSENLSTGMRRAAAMQLTRIGQPTEPQFNRSSSIFALGG